MEILVCRCEHGFTLSEKQKELFPGQDQRLVSRTDDRLIQSFKDGDRRGDGGSTLDIATIPDGAHYRIVSDRGRETIYWSMSEINQA
jgi:hypothetical protein